MKFALFALCAIAATMAHESVTLDDSTDLIQESAMIDTGIATHAKVHGCNKWPNSFSVRPDSPTTEN